MTRITTFQAAGILVAALMCVSEVCYAYNKNTTGPIKTTTEVTINEPTTKTASNTTATGSNMTTNARNTTTSKTTTATEPTTTTVSNMTTAVSSMTTESTALFGILTTVARWQVWDMDSKLCMLMDFDGTIGDVYHGVIEQIPSYSSISRSDCSSSSYSAFVLDFNTISAEWEIVLNFTSGEDSFKLHTLSVSRSTSTTPLSFSETADFFDVPLGDYYTCSHFNYSLGSLFQLNLTNPLFQPFVQKTEGGENLGEPYLCPPAHSGNYGAIGGGLITPVILIGICCAAKHQLKHRGCCPRVAALECCNGCACCNSSKNKTVVKLESGRG